MLYLSDFLTSLAYAMGERSVNSSTSGPRTDFIQDALVDAYRAFPWQFAQRTTDLTPVDGVVAIPAGFDYVMPTAAFYTNGTQIDMKQVDVKDKGNYQIGDNVYWITSPSEGNFEFNTYETAAPITFTYQETTPVLDSSGLIGTAYPTKKTIVQGARIFVKLGQNPDADVSQEQAQFDAAIAKDIAAQMVAQPRKLRRQVGRPTGGF